MLEELRDDIQVLDLYTRSNANSPELHDVRCQLQVHPLFHNKLTVSQTLVALYTNILAFCRHARRVFSMDQERGTSLFYCDMEGLSCDTGPSSFIVLAKAQWAPFEEEFGEIRSNLNRYTAKLGRLTAAITMNTTLDINEELKKASSTQARMFIQECIGNKI